VRALALCLLAVVILSGCSSRGERYYQRAEQFFAQGQFQLAADEYRRVVGEDPRCPLADDAAYKLAYLYREEMGSLPEAIETYAFLAERYPDSPYADDALLWVLYLQGHDLKDMTAARKTYDLLCNRFAGQKDVCARAHLQLARALMTSGDFTQADAEAKQLLNLYPDQSRQAAAAMLLRARLVERLNQPADRAVKLYEQIVKTYPDTLSAVEAKRAIGWVYYGERGKQMQAERLAMERAARVISGVPAFAADQGTPRHRPLICLRSLLAQRGTAVSLEELLAVSGVAFEFHYDPKSPDLTGARLARSALAVAAEQYGFAVITWSAPSAEASFASLAQNISQGRPVMVPQAGAGRWLIVTGYRPAENRLYVLPGRNGQARPLSKPEFVSLWAGSTSGHTAVVTGPYYQFCLGQRVQSPGAQALVQNTARSANAALHEQASGAAAAGLRAYDVLGEQVTAMAAATAAGQQPLRRWAERGLAALLADRRAAATALAGLAGRLSGGSQSGVSEAAATYADVVRLGEQLRMALLSLTKPAEGAEPPPEASWPEAAQLVHEMRAADERAAGQLAEAAR
jgi:TolA-binding protein